MSLFMAAMRQELREHGRIDGFGGLSSAAWALEAREYETKLEEDRQRQEHGQGREGNTDEGR